MQHLSAHALQVFYELVFEVRLAEAGKSMSLAVPLVVGFAPVLLAAQVPFSATGLLMTGRAPAGYSPMLFSESTYATGSIGPAAASQAQQVYATSSIGPAAGPAASQQQQQQVAAVERPE